MTARHARRELLRAGAAAGLALLAGCGLLPEESEPIEASAGAAATLAADGYEEVTADRPTIEPTVTVEFSGDVEFSSRQQVIATLFRRVYAAEGLRVGLLAAPAVRVVDQPEVVRDPTTALSPTELTGLALDREVAAVGDWAEAGARTVLGTETSVLEATGTVAGTERRLRFVRVRAGADSVTALVAGEAEPPFGAVRHGG